MAISPQNTRRITRAARAILVSPAVVLLATAVRLLIVANYNVPTAISVVTSGGVTGALLGTAVMLIAKFLPFLALALIMFRKWQLFPLALFGAALVSPAYSGVVNGIDSIYFRTRAWVILLQHDKYVLFWRDERECIVLLLLAIAATCWDKYVDRRDKYLDEDLRRKLDREQQVEYHWNTVNIMAGLSILMVVITYCSFMAISTVFSLPTDKATYSSSLEEVWLPPEQIKIKAGSAVVGYVLSTSDGWFIVLVNQTRTISYIPANTVIARVVCQLPQYQQRVPKPLINLATTASAHIPLCPSG